MGIGIFSILFFLFITVVCFIPFGISLLYFIIGIRSLLLGKKEKSPVKVAGGYNALFLSTLSMIAIFFLWYWLCHILLAWKI